MHQINAPTPALAPAIELINLEKIYTAKNSPPKHALKNISLTVPRGAFFGLLGANGAGKSTMINILAGLVHKTSGVAKICGHDIIKDMRAARAALGVVPQELVLDTFFTVREALEIQAGYYGIPKHQRRTDAIIEAMGLQDKANVASRKLSGGMRRRLLVGKALVHQPQVLILDEPTAGVDVELRQQLWSYVRTLNKAGTTVLLTTHYLEEAEALCDEIAIINHGELISYGSKQDLMAKVDSKVLRVTPVQAVVQLPESLQAQGWELEQGKLSLRYTKATSTLDALLTPLREAGIVIQDISTEEANLEDIFLQMTTSKPANAALGA